MIDRQAEVSVQLIALTPAQCLGGLAWSQSHRNYVRYNTQTHIFDSAFKAGARNPHYKFVPCAEPTAVGHRRRMAREPNAEAPRSRRFVPSPTNSERRGTTLGGDES